MRQRQPRYTQIMGSFNRKRPVRNLRSLWNRSWDGKIFSKISQKTLDTGLAKCSQFMLYKQQLIGASCGYRTINCSHGQPHESNRLGRIVGAGGSCLGADTRYRHGIAGVEHGGFYRPGSTAPPARHAHAARAGAVAAALGAGNGAARPAGTFHLVGRAVLAPPPRSLAGSDGAVARRGTGGAAGSSGATPCPARAPGVCDGWDVSERKRTLRAVYAPAGRRGQSQGTRAVELLRRAPGLSLRRARRYPQSPQDGAVARLRSIRAAHDPSQGCAVAGRPRVHRRGVLG